MLRIFIFNKKYSILEKDKKILTFYLFKICFVHNQNNY